MSEFSLYLGTCIKLAFSLILRINAFQNSGRQMGEGLWLRCVSVDWQIVARLVLLPHLIPKQPAREE